MRIHAKIVTNHDRSLSIIATVYQIWRGELATYRLVIETEWCPT